MEQGDETYDDLLDGGYVGFREFMQDVMVVIPESVKEAYQRHFSGSWYEEAPDDRRLLCYLNGFAKL